MSNRSLKLKLHQIDPKCHWCQRVTLLTNIAHVGSNPNPLMATIDHIVSRYNPERWVKRKPHEIRKVLACFECNNRRASEETARLSKEELFRRGNGFALNPKGKPRIIKTLTTVQEVIDILQKDGIVLENTTTETQCTTND